MENLLYFWLVVALIFLIMEIGSPGLFYFVSFSFGAFFAAQLSLYTDSFMHQAILFFIGTVVSLALLKYLIKKYSADKKALLTNVYALQGKRGLVIQAIDQERPGQVKIDGEIWSAKTVEGQKINTGTIVEVVSISGAFVYVRDIK